MYLIDNSTKVSTKPTKAPAGLFGYFTNDGPGTIVDADFLNGISDEFKNIVEGAGLTLDKEDDSQVLQALEILIENQVTNMTDLTVAGEAVFNDEAVFNSDVTIKGELKGDDDNNINASNVNLSVYKGTFSEMIFTGDSTYSSSTLGTTNRGAISQSLLPTGMPTFTLSTTPEETGNFEIQRPIATRWHEACPAIIQPFGNSTSVTNIGCAHTAIGTATARNVVGYGTNIVSKARRIGFVSAATAGSLAGLYFTQACWAPSGNGFCLSFTFSPSSAVAIAGSRAFYGVAAATAAPTNVEPSTIGQCFGIAKLSTSQNLHLVMGGAAPQTPVDLGVNFPADGLGDTLYRVNIYVYSDGWLGTVIKGSIEAVRGSPQYALHNFSYMDAGGRDVLPDATIPLAPRFWRCNNATAAAIALDLGVITVEDLPH